MPERLPRTERKALNAVPFSDEFKSTLSRQRKGNYIGQGLLVKVGEAKGRRQFTRHNDYALSFTLQRYKTRKAAADAARLHARFYALLARTGFMPPETQPVLHENSKGNPSITVVRPSRYGEYPFQTIQLGGSPYVSELRERLFGAFPGLQEISHDDLNFDHNYCYEYGPQGGGRPKLVHYLDDLHVFRRPHHPDTLEWIRRTLAANK